MSPRRYDAVALPALRAVIELAHSRGAELTAETVLGLLDLAERAVAACRACRPHHDGGHSRTGALLRDVLGEPPTRLVSLDDTKAVQQVLLQHCRMMDAIGDYLQAPAGSVNTDGLKAALEYALTSYSGAAP